MKEREKSVIEWTMYISWNILVFRFVISQCTAMFSIESRNS